jgi:transposase
LRVVSWIGIQLRQRFFWLTAHLRSKWHPNVTVHYTPTYSSWLNQVEIWFSKLQRDLIARGIFASRTDLKRKIMRYIRAHNANAKPFKWTYRNAAHRITP